MDLCVLTPPPRSVSSSTAIFPAARRSPFHEHRPGLRTVGCRFLVSRFTWLSLVFAVATAVLLHPALAAERKHHAQSQAKKESGAYPSKQDLLTAEESILLFTNTERHARGLPIFQRGSALMYLARRQSENMCAAAALEHESDAFPDGWRKFTDRLKVAGLTSGAENIAYRTFREKPEKWARAVVSGWMKSPHHRKNILNPRWRYLGVGIRMCGNRIAYAAQFFSSDPGRIH
jgi:uncharacterized protein YkwD